MTKPFFISMLALCGLLAGCYNSAAAAEPGVYRDSVNPHWFAGPDGSERFWYRVDLKGEEKEFILVNADTRERGPAFDNSRLAAALGSLLAKPVDAKALPFDSLTYSADGRKVDLHGEDEDFELDPESYAVKKTARNEGESDSLTPGKTLRPSGENGPATSIKFINRLPRAVDIYWLTPDGRRQFYETLEPNGEFRQHTYAGHTWLAAEKNGDSIAVYEAEEEPGVALIGAPGQVRKQPGEREREKPGPPADNATSPDGRWKAVVHGDNLFLRNAASGKEEQLTSGASPADSYSRNAEAERGIGMEYKTADPETATPEIYWAPDSRHFVAMRHTTGSQRRISFVQSSPGDQVQPKLVSIPYLKPGDDVPYAKPHLFDAGEGREIPVSDSLFANPWSIDDVRWSPDSRQFTFEFNQRGHQVFRILGVDADSGAARPVVDERSKTFICYSSKFFVQYLDKTGEIIWMSERDGWNHLYLYDANTGRVKNQITRGDWAVRGVDRVDEAGRQIWFHAGGMNAGEDPYYVEYYRINFDGTGLTALTSGNGTHIVKYSPDRRYLIDTWSRVNQPPINELHRTADGRLVCRLEETDAGELYASGWLAPEPFAAKGRDGVTDIYGVIFRSKNFDPKKSYPVIEDIYAGPQDSYVQKRFETNFEHQDLADRGFVIVQIDGMGTPNRSKAFHDVCWKNLADSGFPDRIAWLRAAAKKYPWMDLSRMGIFGVSAGGQNALRALLDHGDFYKACVADSGCHDNRMDKIWWNEQWMGWPVDKSYVRSSNVVDAHKLQGKLLLMVGEMDQNVDPASTMQVVNALIKANKDFALLVMPNMGHGVSSTAYGRKRLIDFFVATFLNNAKT